jgi:mRNA interferase RelE/StbE
LNVSFKRSFVRDLKQLKNKALLRQVQEIIEQLETASSLGEVSRVKKIQGNDFYYRIRLGEHRLGLFVKGDEVTCVRLLHRKDIYRYFP